MFVCAGESEQFPFAEPIGIGMVDAAITLTHLCLEQNPKEIIFVGTAGSYGRIGLMEIVESSTALNIEMGFFEGKSYSPIENKVTTTNVSRETREADSKSLESVGLKPESLYAPKVSRDGGWETREADSNSLKLKSTEILVNTSHYITTDPVSAQHYLDHGIDLENMEFYGVLKVAERFGIPARGVFLVTNYCQPDAHETFLANHAEAKSMLTRYIKEHYVP